MAYCIDAKVTIHICIPCVACAVDNVKDYRIGCEVSSCDVGWKVSEDKDKCIANQCKCLNGAGTSEANCPVDGAFKCESCNAGFELNQEKMSCDGTLWRLQERVVGPGRACFEKTGHCLNDYSGVHAIM